MTTPILHHEPVAAPGAATERWLFVLHGIYGAGRNWTSVIRRTVQGRPEWGAVLVDLREHGRSRGFPPPHTLEAAARDLTALSDHLGLGVDALLGHSFGGKVALTWARHAGAGLRQLWIIDSTPGAGSPGGASWEALAILRRLPETFASREAAVQALSAEGLDDGVAQWMATNLERTDGSVRWRFDLDAMEALLQDFFPADVWDVLEEPPGSAEVHLVKADGSDLLSGAAVKRIEETGRRNGRVFLHRLPGGHWLNADNPDGMVELLSTKLA